MNILFNFDLLLNSINIAAIAILGITVVLNNPRSRINRIFLSFSFIAIAYAIINYLSYNTNNPTLILWFLRFVLFSSVWYSFLLFHFIYVFSSPGAVLPWPYQYILIPITIIISLVTLSPFAFPRIEYLAPIGQVTKAVHGPGIAFFGIAVIFFVLSSIILLLNKVLHTKAFDRRQFILILIGISITYTLIIVFNFILPVIFNNLIYIPLVPLFTIPFISLAAYAIIKHHLFNVRTIATELLVFALWLTLLIITVQVDSVQDLILHAIVFIATVVLGILLIRSVMKEVHTREKMEELAVKLEVANDELKKIDEVKSDFISIASHQLRTPLSIIKGYISMMREGTYGKLEEKIIDPLQKVYISNERLISLVSDLLDLSRMERGKMVYDYKIVQMTPLVNSLAIDFKIVAGKKGLEFVWEPKKIHDYVRADENKIRQVVINLIDNAIKYTSSGSIKISLDEEGNNLRFSVTDTGPGLSPEDVMRLFQKFSRGQNEQKTHVEGLGLGLYIAKLIAQAHGGDLQVSSPGKGKGSTFSLVLPIYSGTDTPVKA